MFSFNVLQPELLPSVKMYYPKKEQIVNDAENNRDDSSVITFLDKET